MRCCRCRSRRCGQAAPRRKGTRAPARRPSPAEGDPAVATRRPRSPMSSCAACACPSPSRRTLTTRRTRRYAPPAIQLPRLISAATLPLGMLLGDGMGFLPACSSWPVRALLAVSRAACNCNLCWRGFRRPCKDGVKAQPKTRLRIICTFWRQVWPVGLRRRRAACESVVCLRTSRILCSDCLTGDARPKTPACSDAEPPS